MENKLTSAEKRKKALLEARDLFAGSAFPFMLMLILGATVIGYIVYGGQEDLGLKIVILVVGEALLIASTVIFGKQNGAVAYKRTVQNTNKRNINSSDIRAKLYVGEYAVYKGVIIGFIVCVPFIIFQIIGASYPNKVCEFVLMYIFGWAYFPFKLANLSQWLNLLWVLPYVAIHTGAYVWGGYTEKKKQDIIAKQEEDRLKYEKNENNKR